MAREEHEREDLLAEATALVDRVEIAVEGFDEHLVVGFRRDGAASVYFGEDPALHFNSRGELRRAYAAGRLYKAERGRLVALTRERSDAEVALVRHELDVADTAAFLQSVTDRLVALRTAFANSAVQTVGQVPADRDVPGRVVAWLSQLVLPPAIAASPRVT